MLNQADLMGGAGLVPVRPDGIAVSALTGDGLLALQGAIDRRILAGMEVADYVLPPQDGARLAWLYQHGEVLERADAEDGLRLRVRLLPANRARFERDG